MEGRGGRVLGWRTCLLALPVLLSLLLGPTFASASIVRMVDVTSGAMAPPPAGLISASYAWGDYDKDSLADLAFIGTVASSTPSVSVYRQTSPGSFVNLSGTIFTTTPPGSTGGSIGWADVDSSGSLDLLYTGGGLSAF